MSAGAKPDTGTAGPITMPTPDDWHLHLRDGAMLATTVPASAAHYGRAIIMPNTDPPITDCRLARAYRRRILAARPPGNDFEPLMTLYLTDRTDPAEIRSGRDSGLITAAKLYPAGATTGSAAGVTDLRALYPVFAAMEQCDMPLLMHGETTDGDIFDREAMFIERHLVALLRDFPALRLVLEHISTAAAADFVRDGPARLAATITPQHLLLNRNDLLAGGLRPHHYCLPVVKREADRQAIIRAACGAHPRFFLGTDSAPHHRRDKQSACGCAGCYSAPWSLALYAGVFEQEGALHRLADFAAWRGAAFYGLAPGTGRLQMVRHRQRVPRSCAGGTLVPLGAGQTLAWRARRRKSRPGAAAA